MHIHRHSTTKATNPAGQYSTATYSPAACRYHERSPSASNRKNHHATSNYDHRNYPDQQHPHSPEEKQHSPFQTPKTDNPAGSPQYSRAIACMTRHNHRLRSLHRSIRHRASRLRSNPHEQNAEPQAAPPPLRRGELRWCPGKMFWQLAIISSTVTPGLGVNSIETVSLLLRFSISAMYGCSTLRHWCMLSSKLPSSFF